MITLNESYRYCKKLTFNKAKNFYFSFIFLPRNKKKYISSFYAYCRIADDIADDVNLSDEAKIKSIDLFLSILDKCYTNENVNHILFTSMQDTINKNNIKKKDLVNLIDGVKQDVFKDKYDNFNELYDYCFKVASEVAFVCIDIFLNNPDKTLYVYGEKLGIALQLTNIIRDIKEDYDFKRRYIPMEYLKKFGLTEEEFDNSLKKKELTKKMEELIFFMIDLSEKYYREAESNLKNEYKKDVITLEIIRNIYYSLLQEIKKDVFRIMKERVTLTTLKKVKILIKTYFF